MPRFSPEGSSIAFLSHANNLVTNDDRGPFLDLFRRDLLSRTTTLVSVNRTGTGGANYDIAAYSLSSNGLFIAFETSADNLLDGDANLEPDVYLRDVVAGTTSLISINAAGSGPGDGPSSNPLVSADGRYVVFESAASDLVTNDFNGTTDIFIRDRLAGITRLVSVNRDGSASPDGGSQSPAMTPDARFVAFVSRATNLSDGIANRLGEVYVRDLVRGTNLWANAGNLHLPREPAWDAFGAANPALSDDGRFVAFETSHGAVIRVDLSRPTNSVLLNYPLEADPPSVYPYYFQDNPRFTRFAEGVQVSSLTMSTDGRYVAIATGTNGSLASAVYRIDFEHLVERVDFITDDGRNGFYLTNITHTSQLVRSNGVTNSALFFESHPAISANGERIAFLGRTAASQDSGSSFSGPLGVWVRDLRRGEEQLMSRDRFGAAAILKENAAVALSCNGSCVAWESPDDEMLEEDANGALDVYARSISSGELLLVSQRHPTLPATTGYGTASVRGGALSADGRRVVMLTWDSNLGRRDTNRYADAYVRDLSTGANLLLSMAPTNRLDARSLLGPGSNDVLFATITSDGRYAAYTQWGLAKRSMSFSWRDLQTETIRPVYGTLLNGMKAPVLGPDGRLVAVSIDSGHLGAEDVFLFWSDYPSSVFFGDPWEVGKPSRGWSRPGDGPSMSPTLSPDGSWIAFLSRAGNFTPETYPPQTNYQVVARQISQDPVNFPDRPFVTPLRLISYTTAASPEPGGQSIDSPLPNGASNLCFSGDSRYLIFEAAPRLIYRHDLVKESVITITSTQSPQGAVYLTNVARVTNLLVCADCAAPSASGDGRYVVFEAPWTAGGIQQVLIRDLELGSTELVSANPAGHPGNHPSFHPLLSFDARYVVYVSQATDLVANDNNLEADIFVRDRLRGVTLALSYNYLGTATANRGSSAPILSADGRSVAFQSFASDLVPGDYNDTRDVFVVRFRGVDGDRDGMDDDWEMTYFGTLDRDGSGDFDGDGRTDAEEFRIGTNPTDQESILRVRTLKTARNTPSPGLSTSTVFWNTVPGRTYRVQTKAAFEETWTDVPGDVVATAWMSTKTHTTRSEPARFYRVVAQ